MAAGGNSDARRRIESSVTSEDKSDDISLLLWGKTGRGKSATGNTILGRNEFVSLAGEESTTKDSDFAWARINDRIVKVVDTPGIYDTDIIDATQIKKIALKNMMGAFSHCASGFSAVVLVLKFNEKMTGEERSTIALLKEILGENVLKTHGICVVTHGDVFDTEFNGIKSFQDWCRGKSGYIGELFKECEYRCVLMSNKCKKPRQVFDLLAQVDALESKGRPYEHALFTDMMEQRKREQAENGGITEKLVRDTNLVLEDLLAVINGQDLTECPSRLKTARAKIAEICDALEAKDGNNIKKAIGGLVDVSSALYELIPKQASTFSIDDDFLKGLQKVIINLDKVYNEVMKPDLRPIMTKIWDRLVEHKEMIIGIIASAFLGGKGIMRL